MKTGNNSTISNLQASSVGGLVLLLMLAGAINVVAAPKDRHQLSHPEQFRMAGR
jgi:hypothetical protein